MDDLPNYNKIAVELIKDLGLYLKEQGADLFKLVLVNFEKPFSSYLKKSVQRYSLTKTLLYRDRPVRLDKIYIPAELATTQNKKRIDTRLINSLYELSKKIVITGTAGSGKSMFSKYLFLKTIESKQYGIPIYIELRLLNNTDHSILSFIRKQFEGFGLSFSEKHIDYCLKNNRFVLILDGFDELDPERRDAIQVDLLELSKKYLEMWFFITSRPDEVFTSWTDFRVLTLRPMTKEKAISLIEKLDYDKSLKAKFIKKLNDGLYDKHVTFASNPLLITIMLLTYEQYADIPEKIHIFYDQAFDVLFFKHDATKSTYKRKMNCPLPIDDFKRALSAFALVTHLKNEINFTNSSVLKQIENAKKLTGLAFNIQSFLRDLLTSVCILVNDGMYITFSHRSFQEYFAALYISTMEEQKRKKVLAKLAESASSRNVIDLLFEINKPLVEKELFMPLLQKLLSLDKPRQVNLDDYLPTLRALISLVTLDRIADGKGRILFSVGRDYQLVMRMRDFYKIGKNPYASFDTQSVVEILQKQNAQGFSIPLHRDISEFEKSLLDNIGTRAWMQDEMENVKALLERINENAKTYDENIENILFS